MVAVLQPVTGAALQGLLQGLGQAVHVLPAGITAHQADPQHLVGTSRQMLGSHEPKLSVPSLWHRAGEGQPSGQRRSLSMAGLIESVGHRPEVSQSPRGWEEAHSKWAGKALWGLPPRKGAALLCPAQCSCSQRGMSARLALLSRVLHVLTFPREGPSPPEISMLKESMT